MVIRERVCRCGVADLRKRQSGCTSCEPELTAVYADRPLRDFAVERDIMGQPCPLRWSLPQSRDVLVHRTTDASVTWFLAPHAAYRKACSRKSRQNAAVLKEHVAFQLSVSPLASCPLSGVSEDCASTLESVCKVRVAQHGRLPVVLLQI